MYLFMCSLFLALRVSGAICTHSQEHNCSVQPYVCVWLWYVSPMEQVLATVLKARGCPKQYLLQWTNKQTPWP
jgi:hypothetical protein